MVRTVLVVASLAAALSGCNVCQRIYNADQAANDKGRDCSNSSNSSLNVQTCSAGLSSCSPDDVNKLNDYASCLEKLDQCVSSQSFSWGLQRLGCIQTLQGISGTCYSAIN
jgi:hypothetical protein